MLHLAVLERIVVAILGVVTFFREITNGSVDPAACCTGTSAMSERMNLSEEEYISNMVVEDSLSMFLYIAIEFL